MTRTRSSLGWTVEGTEGSRKEVGSVQGEGDDGRGAVDAAAAEFCLHPLVLTHTLAPTPLGGGLEVGTFTWPDLKWSDRRLRTGAVTRGREGGEGAHENILFSLVPRSFFSDSVLPYSDLSEASLLGGAGCGRGRSHAAGVTRILLPPPQGRQDGSRGRNM